MSASRREAQTDAFHLEPPLSPQGVRNVPLDAYSPFSEGFRQDEQVDLLAEDFEQTRRGLTRWTRFFTPYAFAISSVSFLTAIATALYVYWAQTQTTAQETIEPIVASEPKVIPSKPESVVLSEEDLYAQRAPLPEVAEETEQLAEPVVEPIIISFQKRENFSYEARLPLETGMIEREARALGAQKLGYQRAEAGHWESACQAFRDAWNWRPTHQRSYNLAICLDQQTHSEAVVFYRRALSERGINEGAALTPQERAAVWARLHSLEGAR